MNEYKINISQFGFRKEDIKYEIISMDADHIESRTTYPNGMILHFNQTAESIEVDSNWLFKIEPDNSLTPVRPKD